ncbi:hypothetical protein ACEWY4_004912 [Coilia grayii]|uniref:RAP domain-containing protein n=1 Tax=Coilia grayii TaxID=363190 RepID=A0ABD1KP00_9TELE
MSARLLSRGLARLRLPASPVRPVALSRGRGLQSEHGETQEQQQQEQEQQQQEEEQQQWEAEWLRPAGDYTLAYNPSAYFRPAVGRSGRRGQSEAEDGVPPLGLPPALRQQSNIYSICSSRCLSISNNTLLDLAFGRDGGAQERTAAPPPPQSCPPEVQVDPRAFQRCRPEYRAFTHDLCSRPAAPPPERAALVLQEVAVLRGSMTPADVASFLHALGSVPPPQAPLVRSDSRFSMLLRYGVEALHGFTHAQLLQVLRALVLLDLPPSHSVLELYEAECARRAPELDLHELLLAADLWRCLGRTATRFLERLHECVAGHLGQMGAAELVELVYLLGEGRRCPAPLLGPLEVALVGRVGELQAEEVGAVCLGLFKAQSALSAGAVRSLVDRGLALLPEVSDFALVNVMKLLRFSHLDHLAWLGAMATEIPQRAPHMGAQGLMHVALGCSALHYRDDRVLSAIARRVPEVAAQCRSKDAAKLLWAFGTLGAGPRQAAALYGSLTEVLRRHRAELLRYPQHLLTALLGLAFARQFPHDLLSAALGPDLVRRATASPLELRKDLLTLDGTVALELPGWTGPRLGRALSREVARQLWDFAREDVCRKPEVLEAEAALRSLLGGAEFVRKHMILPHTRSIDLEVRLDPHGRPLPVVSAEAADTEGQRSMDSAWGEGHCGVPLTDELLAQLTSTRRPPPQTPPPRNVMVEAEREGVFSVGVDLTDGLLGCLTNPRHQGAQSGAPQRTATRIAVQVSNRNHYCYRTHILLGLHALKRRQLVLAGYRVVELAHWEWFPLLRRPRAEQLAYLRDKIFHNQPE